MLTSRDLIDAAKARQGITSNYRLARELDVPEKSVSRWYTMKHTPEDPMVLRLCEMAGLDPAEVLPAMYAQRAADGPIRDAWERAAQRLQAVAACLMAGVLSGFLTGGPDAGAQVRTPEQTGNASHFVYYVNCVNGI